MDEMFLIVVILSASLIVLLKHRVLFIVQISYGLLVYHFLPEGFLTFALVAQILFSLWIFLRVCYAAHYQHQLENEKTHRVPQHFTVEGRSGRRKNFLFK